MSVTLLIIVFSILASKECEGMKKRWIRTWDLNDEANWEGRKLPCGGKVAYLPHRPISPVFLGDRLTTASLDLPVEGQLIFGDGANLVLDHTLQEDCQDAKWSHQNRDSWWDPDAWHSPNFDDPSSAPVPHVHRVPCTIDDVKFTNPNLSLYSVHLTSPPITVSSMTIGNKGYSTSEFAAYTRSGEGQSRFVGVSSQRDNAPLYVERPSECVDITGCLCGTEAASSRICHIMNSKCPQASCENPVKMKGFCCQVCGADVAIAHNGSLPLRDVRNLLKNFLSTPVAQHLSAYSSKMDDDLYHVYFTAVTDGGDYQAASLAFKTRFEQELGAGGKHTTSLTNSGSPTAKARKGPSAHSVAAYFITLAVCLVIGLAVYYLRKRRVTTQLSFMFRRLESNSRRVSVVSDVGGRRLSTTSSGLMSSYSREGGLRFLNPIFNQSMASLVGAGLGDRQPVPTTVPEDQVEGQHENPMYTAYEKMSPEEQQASEDTLRAQDANESGLLTLSGSSLAKQDMILHGPSKPDLDVIVEERQNSDEVSNTGYDESQTEKRESGSEDIMDKPQDNKREKTSEVNDREETVTDEQPESTVIPGFPLDFESAASTAIKDDGSTVLEEDIFVNLETCVTPQNPRDISTKKDESETPHAEDSISVSSSDDSLDETLNIEGFVPLKDMRFPN